MKPVGNLWFLLQAARDAVEVGHRGGGGATRAPPRCGVDEAGAVLARRGAPCAVGQGRRQEPAGGVVGEYAAVAARVGVGGHQMAGVVVEGPGGAVGEGDRGEVAGGVVGEGGDAPRRVGDGGEPSGGVVGQGRDLARGVGNGGEPPGRIIAVARRVGVAVGAGGEAPSVKGSDPFTRRGAENGQPLQFDIRNKKLKELCRKVDQLKPGDP